MYVASVGNQTYRQLIGKKLKKYSESNKNSYNPRPDFLHIFPTADQEIAPVSDSDGSSAPLIDVVKLAASLQRFADDRDWHQFHSPKNLILALTGEVGELCEIFQWMSDADSISAATDPEIGQAVKDELADVLMYLVRLSSVLGVDLNEAVTQKLASNGQKYPVDKARSNSKKYDRL
ncbi:MazG nucleotide pyrophosphohydrolase domain protein [compost metagenome]